MKDLQVWELATGKVVLKHKTQEPPFTAFDDELASRMSFAPDGRTLATALPDSTVLIWDLVPSGRSTTAADLPRLWDDLIGTDAVQAYAASWRLADSPKETTCFLHERLRPVLPISAEKIRPLLADLDSDDFAKREATTARLRELGDRAAKFLKEALPARPSLEKRHRLEDLLKDLDRWPTGTRLRELRAVAVLERIGTAEALHVLKTLAEGIPEARLTREAKASLERLTARHAAEKR
jgi:hypothetical protein